jgi:hypothetical protein
MIALFLKLLLAHVLGDFIFQPDSWVQQKKNKMLSSKFFYLHGLVHFILLLILLQFDLVYLGAILIIVSSHLVIDFLKLQSDGKYNSQALFVLDQVLHILILFVVSGVMTSQQLNLDWFYNEKTILFVLAVLSVSFVGSIVIKTLMAKWQLAEDSSEDSLENAGKYIGILERLFVFGFILLEQWSAIGLLIAAKSVFRFGDLSRAKDRKLTEYILIGTLISFGLAIFIGVLYIKVVDLL